MFVGEAPGESEDLTGRPFVGPAGKLLRQLINAMGFYRREVFIANALKCRPDAAIGNRKPKREELANCAPYLYAQIHIIRPKVIIALGSVAAEVLLDFDNTLEEMRQGVFAYDHYPVVVTFHPSYVLRRDDRGTEKKWWEDACKALRIAGLPFDLDDVPRFIPS